MFRNSVAVRSIAAYLPGEKIAVSEIDDYLGSIPGVDAMKYYRMIERFAGVRHRHYAVDKGTGALREDAAEMASRAAGIALERAGIDASDIDLIVTTTTTPPFLRGGLAKEVRIALGNPSCATFDLWGACTGIQQAITLAAAAIRAGMYANVLIVGVELASTTGRAENYAPGKVTRLDMLLRGALGDGAGAMVLGRATEGVEDQIVYTGAGTEGRAQSQFHRDVGGSTYPFNPLVFAEGRHQWQHDFQNMVTHGIPYAVAVTRRVLDDLALSIDDIDFYVPAAANVKYATRPEAAFDMSEADMALFGAIKARTFTNFADVGNIPSAAIYIALNDLFERGQLVNDALLMLVSVEGATWGWGATVIRWSAS
jgi:3-oxoacyl-[acyl-carrier-protein] synthase-3